MKIHVLVALSAIVLAIACSKNSGNNASEPAPNPKTDAARDDGTFTISFTEAELNFQYGSPKEVRLGITGKPSNAAALRWRLAKGSELPPGLGLRDEQGAGAVISGSTQALGEWCTTVVAGIDAKNEVSKQLCFVMEENRTAFYPKFENMSEEFERAQIGKHYSQTFQVAQALDFPSGGVRVSLLGGKIPDGLRMNVVLMGSSAQVTISG